MTASPNLPCCFIELYLRQWRVQYWVYCIEHAKTTWNVFSHYVYCLQHEKKTQSGERLIVTCVVNCSKKSIFKVQGHVFFMPDLIQHGQICVHTDRSMYLLTSTPFYGIIIQLFGKSHMKQLLELWKAYMSDFLQTIISSRFWIWACWACG